LINSPEDVERFLLEIDGSERY